MAGSCGASCVAVTNDNQQAVPVASRSCCFSAPLQYSPARLLTRPGKSAETAGQQGQRRSKHSAAAIPGYCLSTEHDSRQGAARVSCCPHAALFHDRSPSSTALVSCCLHAALFHNHSPSSSIALARSPYSSPMGPTISSCACRLPLRMSRAARAIKSQLQVRLSAGGGHRMSSEQAKPHAGERMHVPFSGAGSGLDDGTGSAVGRAAGQWPCCAQAAPLLDPRPDSCSPFLMGDAAHEGTQLEVSPHLQEAGNTPHAPTYSTLSKKNA